MQTLTKLDVSPRGIKNPQFSRSVVDARTSPCVRYVPFTFPVPPEASHPHNLTHDSPSTHPTRTKAPESHSEDAPSTYPNGAIPSANLGPQSIMPLPRTSGTLASGFRPRLRDWHSHNHSEPDAVRLPSESSVGQGIDIWHWIQAAIKGREPPLLFTHYSKTLHTKQVPFFFLSSTFNHQTTAHSFPSLSDYFSYIQSNTFDTLHLQPHTNQSIIPSTCSSPPSSLPSSPWPPSPWLLPSKRRLARTTACASRATASPLLRSSTARWRTRNEGVDETA
ncbi:unnamed protein product [Periconia digitata]|uniref:Uncharacterized protein n=1 Tax=Periconia digitata TaxID=1303443 RepID=A0A9W4UN29_9PLEO|nr:unnamed protein product [Periconia digitata]